MNNRIIININNQLEYVFILICGFILCGFVLYSFIDNIELKTNETTLGAFLCGAVFVIFGLLGLIFKWERRVAINTNGIAYRLYIKSKIRFLIYMTITTSISIYLIVLTGSLFFKSNACDLLMNRGNIFVILATYILLGGMVAFYKLRQYNEVEKYFRNRP